MTPCVLPLVPGYLSAVSAVEATAARRAGDRGAGGAGEHPVRPRVHGRLRRCSAPARRRSGASSRSARRTRSPGFILIVVGLGFIGLLPWPERAVAPGLLQRARGSSVLLGAAFAVCAAPCIGAVLGSILALAGKLGRGRARGASCSPRTRSASAPRSSSPASPSRGRWAWFRWIRDRYRIIQIAGGVTLVALGLLLFFERYWWLNVALNRLLEKVGLDQI